MKVIGLRRLAVVAASAILIASNLGFAAASTVPATSAGDGSGAISGYTISRIRYRVRPSNPGLLNTVTFRLNAAATTVRVELWPGGPWLSCRNTSGRNWRCPGTGSAMGPVRQLSSLRVVAAQ